MTKTIKEVPENAIEVIDNLPVQFNVPESLIKELSKKYTGLVATDKGEYKILSSALTEVRKVRLAIEHTRKALKRPAIDFGNKVQAEAARLTELILKVEEPLSIQKKTYDEAEKLRKAEEEKAESDRISAINNKINAIRDMPLRVATSNADVTQQALDRIRIIEINDETFAEFKEEAEKVSEASITSLKVMLESKKLAEAQAKELKKLKDEKATAVKDSAPVAPKAEEPVVVPEGHELVVETIKNGPVSKTESSSEIQDAIKKPHDKLHGKHIFTLKNMLNNSSTGGAESEAISYAIEYLEKDA